jgi:two-component system, NarL family, nitrate/nitrite response regulator NarL
VTDLLLVDDHAAFREALAFMLDREPDMSVVAQAGSAAEARSCEGGWSVAVVDLGLPDGAGSEVVESLFERVPDARIVVLTASTRPAELAAAYEAGVAGVVQKTARIGEIVDAVRTVAAGGSLVDPGELVEILRQARRQRDREATGRQLAERLTPREREVLQALADGRSNREIAERLHITVETQRTHMVNILGKLGAHSQLQALVIAVRHGIVSVE